eukprot:CAMPEP_0170486024 /NCGR_PEP_ID=MMETSP0208-20121228/5150_1 /TAXON_ID=197538 /ORGANISM="Strombidium inclinatum, Strain S3" /LENGTH=200 /DNA_ID=CAMNT_0010759853 /DNA_START=770 /DNA_END=1374 /DNA_ORIENTATION=+
MGNALFAYLIFKMQALSTHILNLQLSENRKFKHMFDNLKDPILLIKDGAVSFMNSLAIEFVGDEFQLEKPFFINSEGGLPGRRDELLDRDAARPQEKGSVFDGLHGLEGDLGVPADGLGLEDHRRLEEGIKAHQVLPSQTHLGDKKQQVKLGRNYGADPRHLPPSPEPVHDRRTVVHVNHELDGQPRDAQPTQRHQLLRR